jgi:hypothetical protein
MQPKPRLAETLTLTGDDGRTYTVHGYKEYHRGLPGEWIENDLISILLTDKGQSVICTCENPPTFIIEATGVTLRQRD